MGAFRDEFLIQSKKGALFGQGIYTMNQSKGTLFMVGGIGGGHDIVSHTTPFFSQPWMYYITSMGLVMQYIQGWEGSGLVRKTRYDSGYMHGTLCACNCMHACM